MHVWTSAPKPHEFELPLWPSAFDQRQRRKDHSSSHRTKNNPHQDLLDYLDGQPSFLWRLTHISLNWADFYPLVRSTELGINTGESEIADVVR